MPAPTSAPSPRPPARGGVLLASLVLLVTSCAPDAPRPARPGAMEDVGAGTPSVWGADAGADDPRSARAHAARRALRVLTRWDQRRAAALGAADRDALAALYVPGRGLLHQDLTLLRAYRARGLRVVEVVPQVREVTPLAARAGRRRVQVVERLSRVVVRTARGDLRDVAGTAYVTHTLTFVPGARGWRLSSVTRG